VQHQLRWQLAAWLSGSDCKCGSGKCDTVKNARVENVGVGVEMWEQTARVENSGLENTEAESKGGKCRSRQAVWKAKPILYIERPLSYFLKIVLRLLSG